MKNILIRKNIITVLFLSLVLTSCTTNINDKVNSDFEYNIYSTKLFIDNNAIPNINAKNKLKKITKKVVEKYNFYKSKRKFIT